MKDTKMHFNSDKYSLTKDLYPFMTETLFPKVKASYLFYLKHGIDLDLHRLTFEVNPLYQISDPDDIVLHGAPYKILAVLPLGDGIVSDGDLVLASNDDQISVKHLALKYFFNPNKNSNIDAYFNNVLYNYESRLRHLLWKIRADYQEFNGSKFKYSKLIELINYSQNLKVIGQDLSNLANVKISVSDSSFGLNNQTEYCITINLAINRLNKITIEHADLFKETFKNCDSNLETFCLDQSMRKLREYLRQVKFIW